MAQADLPELVLHSSTGANENNPNPGLIQSKDGSFYGTASGFNGINGSVFRVSCGSNVYKTLLPLSGNEAVVAGVAEGPDGNLYGTSKSGQGPTPQGAVFRLSKTGKLETLYAFKGTDGANPDGPPVVAADGTIYGTTVGGGVYGAGTSGTVFRLNTSGTLTTLHDFGIDTTGGVGPRSELIFGSDGALYGTTTSGGASGGGTVFRVTTAGAFSVVASFGGSTNGSGPHDLLQGADGNFYGKSFGGQGIVFGVTPAGTVSVLHALVGSEGDFDFNAGDGRAEGGGLIQGADGNLYGVSQYTANGGGNGTLFQVALNGTFTVLLTFQGGAAGANPLSLLQAKDGNMYGTMAGGVFEAMLPGGTSSSSSCPAVSNDGGTTGGAPPPETLLHASTASNELSPNPGLIQVQDGSLYGTSAGFNQVNGSVFGVECGSNVYRSVLAFSGGEALVAGVAVGMGGALEGTIRAGQGTNKSGALFQVSTTGKLDTLHSFAGSDGTNPDGPPLVAPDGTIYGTTSGGGTYNGGTSGTVFQLTPAGTFTTLHDFGIDTGGVDGVKPRSNLIFGSDGAIYGTTTTGGTYNGGTVFRVTTGGVFSVLANLGASTNGSGPHDLLQATDGNFYGKSFGGQGIIFGLTPSGTLFVLHAMYGADGDFDFNAGDGRAEGGGLIQAADGKLYGVAQYTTNGGGNGTLFQLGLDGSFTVLYSFQGGTAGGNPLSVMQAKDGNLYGVVAGGVYKISLPEGTSGGACTSGVGDAGAMRDGAATEGGVQDGGADVGAGGSSSGAAGAGGHGTGAAGSSGGSGSAGTKSSGCSCTIDPGSSFDVSRLLLGLAVFGWTSCRRRSRQARRGRSPRI